MLKISDSGNIYLSRGGKKRYYLEDTFVKRYLVKLVRNKDVVNNEILQDIKDVLLTLLKNKRLGNRTKEKLQEINNLVDKIL